MASAPSSDAFNEYMPGAPGKFSNGQIHMNGPGSYQVGVRGVGDVPVLTSMHLVYCGTSSSTRWDPASTARTQLFVHSLGRQRPTVSPQRYNKPIA